MGFGVKRSSPEILAWIVQECSEPRRKTHIVCKGNLGSSQASIYLERLVSTGLVVLEGDRFKATDRGLEFVWCYQRLVSLLRPRVDDAHEEICLLASSKCLRSRGSRVFVELPGARRLS